jgi:hypothetical protein
MSRSRSVTFLLGSCNVTQKHDDRYGCASQVHVVHTNSASVASEKHFRINPRNAMLQNRVSFVIKTPQLCERVEYVTLDKCDIFAFLLCSKVTIKVYFAVTHW